MKLGGFITLLLSSIQKHMKEKLNDHFLHGWASVFNWYLVSFIFFMFKHCSTSIDWKSLNKYTTHQNLEKGFLVSSLILLNPVKSHLMERVRKSLKNGHISVLTQKFFKNVLSSTSLGIKHMLKFFPLGSSPWSPTCLQMIGVFIHQPQRTEFCYGRCQTTNSAAVEDSVTGAWAPSFSKFKLSECQGTADLLQNYISAKEKKNWNIE